MSQAQIKNRGKISWKITGGKKKKIFLITRSFLSSLSNYPQCWRCCSRGKVSDARQKMHGHARTCARALPPWELLSPAVTPLQQWRMMWDHGDPWKGQRLHSALQREKGKPQAALSHQGKAPGVAVQGMAQLQQCHHPRPAANPIPAPWAVYSL